MVKVIDKCNFTILREEQRIVGLGKGLANSGIISNENITRTTIALTEFKDILHSMGIIDIHFISTAAMRRAKNADLVQPILEKALNCPMNIISGEKEGYYTFLASKYIFPNKKSLLVMDIGGGSTEFIFGVDKPIDIFSIKLGSVVLYEESNSVSPMSNSEFENLKNTAISIINKNAKTLSNLKPNLFIGVAGTFTTCVAALLKMTEYNPKLISGYAIKKNNLIVLRKKLCKLTTSEQEQFPGITSGRGGLILAGIAIIEAIFEIFEIDNILVNDYALRHGYLMSKIAKES